jgi:hypothetical protein
MFAVCGTILWVLQASPERYSVLSQNDCRVTLCTSPAIADGRILVRQSNAIACFDLRTDQWVEAEKKRLDWLGIKPDIGPASRTPFVSQILAGGRTLAEVRQAAGYASLIMTSVHLHITVDDDATPGALFAMPPA